MKTIKLQEAVEIARETARAIGMSEDIAVELVKLGYSSALGAADDATRELKISSDKAAEKTVQGATEVGKAVARRIIQDKLASLQKKLKDV